MAFNLTRMTVYALISALEEDLRAIVKVLVQQDVDNISFSEELRERAKSRLEKDLGFTYDNVSLYDLVDYLDLGDTFQIINANPTHLPSHIATFIKKILVLLRK